MDQIIHQIKLMKNSGKKEVIKFQFYLHYGELFCHKLQILRVLPNILKTETFFERIIRIKTKTRKLWRLLTDLGTIFCRRKKGANKSSLYNAQWVTQ